MLFLWSWGILNPQVFLHQIALIMSPKLCMNIWQIEFRSLTFVPVVRCFSTVSPTYDCFQFSSVFIVLFPTSLEVLPIHRLSHVTNDSTARKVGRERQCAPPGTLLSRDIIQFMNISDWGCPFGYTSTQQCYHPPHRFIALSKQDLKEALGIGTLCILLQLF